LALLVCAVLAPLSAGCIAVAAGAAVGAGVGGYWVFTHRLYRDYPRELPQTTVAVRAALAELRFPPPTEETKDDIVTMETRAPDGSKISVEMRTIGGRVPADGTTTRVGIHVGAFGDEETSARIHDTIARQLGVPALAPQAAPALRPVAQPAPGAAETPPPPLAK
jgi:hypothetical protein